MKFLVIGLDGASYDLIMLWKDELPNLSKIMEESAYGELESTIPPITSPAWMSFATGKNPGRIGIYDFQIIDFNKRQANIVNSTHYGPTIWDKLSESDKNVGIINFPATYPPKKLNGFLVSGFLSPLSNDYTYPSTLIKEINEIIRDYQIYPNINPYFSRKEEYLKDIQKIFTKRVKLTNYLMKKYDCHFFLVVFMVLDWIQHYFWHYMDKSHPLHKTNETRFTNVIKEWYKKLDATIGNLVKELSKDGYILILSDHGFGPLYGSFLINSWLFENGYLKLKENFSTKVYSLLTKIIGSRLVLSILSKSRILEKTSIGSRISKKGLINKIIPKDLKMDDPFLHSISDLPIDWKKTKAFGFGYNNQIYITLGPANGKKYHEIRNEIITKLKKIKFADNFKVNFKVFKKEEIYSGSYLHNAPDIVYLINDGEFTQSNKIRKGRTWETSATKTGDHSLFGVWMLAGPGIKNHVKKIRILDLAPTILYILDEKIPKEMDGRVVTEIFQEEFLQSNPIKYESKIVHVQSTIGKEEPSSYTTEEEIRERLKQLGYLE